MLLNEVDEKVSDLEKQIETLNTQMMEICDNRDMKTSIMPKEYYELLKERQHLESELRPLWKEQSRIRRERQEHSSHT